MKTIQYFLTRHTVYYAYHIILLHNFGGFNKYFSNIHYISGLLNLRGNDIPSAALFLSFVIVKTDMFELFVDSTKVSPEIRGLIEQDSGRIYPYEQVTDRLENLVNVFKNKT